MLNTTKFNCLKYQLLNSLVHGRIKKPVKKTPELNYNPGENLQTTKQINNIRTQQFKS